MNRISKFLGTLCDACPFCRHARENPQTTFGRIMAWHGKWCPAWKAWEEMEKERQRSTK
mgnify:CR=1 FL=1